MKTNTAELNALLLRRRSDMPTHTMGSRKMIDSFKVALAARAAKEGVSLDGLVIEVVSNREAWTDELGLMFSGLPVETLDRVANFFYGYADKYLRNSPTCDERRCVNREPSRNGNPVVMYASYKVWD